MICIICIYMPSPPKYGAFPGNMAEGGRGHTHTVPKTLGWTRRDAMFVWKCAIDTVCKRWTLSQAKSGSPNVVALRMAQTSIYTRPPPATDFQPASNPGDTEGLNSFSTNWTDFIAEAHQEKKFCWEIWTPRGGSAGPIFEPFSKLRLGAVWGPYWWCPRKLTHMRTERMFWGQLATNLLDLV